MISDLAVGQEFRCSLPGCLRLWVSSSCSQAVGWDCSCQKACMGLEHLLPRKLTSSVSHWLSAVTHPHHMYLSTGLSECPHDVATGLSVSSPRQGKKEAMVYFMAQSKKSSTVSYATFSLLEVSPQVHTEDSQGRSIERFTEVIFKPPWCHWTFRHIERLGLGWREKKGHFFKMSYYQHIKSEIDSVKDSWSFEF